jgi:MHS family proline/betaine transporter-like MFS transporter
MKKKFGILSVFLGNLFEHYDTALYGLLSPFLAPLFFPTHDEITALILTYGMIPISMLIRPVGSLIFGYVGDYYGRQRALYISLTGMAIVSLLISCLPEFSDIGYLAPVLLLLGRMFLSFFASGESSGGAVYIIENSSESKEDLMSGLFGSSTIAGIILASGLVTLFSHFEIIESGWRLLYFLGGITGVFGIIMRRYGRRNEEFTVHKKGLFDQFKTLWRMRLVVLAIAVTTGYSYANYSISLGMINGFIPLVTDVTRTEVMKLNTLLLILDFATLPLFSLCCNRDNRVKFMIASVFVSTIIGIPLFSLLDGATLAMIAFVRICLVLVGVWFASTFYSWSQNLVEKEHRYTVVSFASALGALLFGGPTGALSLWLYQETGIVSSVAWYWIALGLCSGILMLRLESQKNEQKIAVPTHN